MPVASTSPRALHRLGALLVIVVATLAGLATAAPVSAHTEFSGSTPADGDVVTEPVSLVTLVFTNESEQAGDGFVVRDANGEVRAPTTVSTLDDKVFTLTFDPPLTGGRVGVRWSVRAGDSHPIEGAFSFTITSPSADGAAPATEASTATGGGAEAISTDDAHMSQMTAEEMAAMGHFLDVDTTRPGETQATVGRLVSFTAIALAIGWIAFAATTFRGRTDEIRSLVTAVRIVGGFIVVGAVIEYTGVARIADESLLGYWTSSPGFAAALRMLAGLAIAGGLVATTVGTRSASRLKPLSSASNTTDQLPDATGFWESERVSARRQSAPRDVVLDDSPLDPSARGLDEDGDDRRDRRQDRSSEPVRRWVADRSSALAFAGCAAAVISFWFDGHTVSKGFRPLHAVANSVHVLAGSVWLGGVVAIAAVLWTRHRRGTPPRALELVVRFSSIATVALGAVIAAGLIMAVSILDSVGDLTGTEWGQVLLLKTGAVGLAVVGGAYNHFRLLPALEANPRDPALHERVRSVVTAEAIMLCFVVVVTAWLVASTT